MIALGGTSEVNLDKLNAIINQSPDPSAFLAELAMNILYHDIDTHFHVKWWPPLKTCILKLHRLGHNRDSPGQKYGNQDPERLVWDLRIVPDVVRLLLDCGAHPNTAEVDGMTPLHVFMITGLFRQCVSAGSTHDVRKHVLNILIESGADVLHVSHDGTTISEKAQANGHLDVWCEALQENGKSIEEIVRLQRQEWLLDDGISSEEETDSKAFCSSSEYTSEDVSDAELGSANEHIVTRSGEDEARNSEEDDGEQKQ
jgi:ankyrin repeat protein